MPKRTSTFSAATLAILAALTSSPTNAAPYTYTGGSGTTASPVTGNFSGGFSDGVSNTSLPVSDYSTSLYFGGDTNYTATNNSSTFNINSLNFSNTGAVILTSANYQLSLGGTSIPTINLNNTGALTVSMSLSLTANTAFTGTGSAAFKGLIMGAGYGLTLGNSASPFSGTLTLSASNVYTGGTTINGGILSVSTLTTGGTSNIGKSSNAASNLVLNGGTLRFSGANGITDRMFTLGTNGGTLDASGSVALNFNNTGAVAFSSGGSREALTLAGANTGSNTLAAKITDNGAGPTSLTKTGTGNWILTGANTYTGGTTIDGGTLTVSSSVGTGALAVNNTGSAATSVVINFNATAETAHSVTSLSSTISGDSGNTATIRLQAGNTLTDTQSGTINYAGSVTGPGTLNINGQGSGSSSALINYTGNDSAAQTNIGANATLQLNNSAGPALSGPVGVATGGTLTISPNSTHDQVATANPDSYMTPTAAAVTLNGGTLNANGSDGAVDDPTHLATANVTQSMGALALGSGGTLANPSLLNLGAGTTADPLILAFADSSMTLGVGYLNVINYTGTTNALYIGTTANLQQSDLNRIAYNGLYGAFAQLNNGQLVLSAAPEPDGVVSSLMGVAGISGLAVLRRRSTARTV